MHTSSYVNYPRRNVTMHDAKLQRPVAVLSLDERIRQQLRDLGVSRIAQHSMEARYLPRIIHQNELIEGVVYGRTKDGIAMMLATNLRAIYLDKKPFFANEDEITYDVVAGVSHSHAGPGSMITLHTRVKDYIIQTFNEKCARGFVEVIESKCIENARASKELGYEKTVPFKR